MIRTLLAVTALLLLAMPASAALTLQIGDVSGGGLATFDMYSRTLTVDVYVAGWEGSAGTQIGGIAASMFLTGADAHRFTAHQLGGDPQWDPDLMDYVYPEGSVNNKSPAAMANLLFPEVWALSGFASSSMTQAANSDGFAQFRVNNTASGGPLMSGLATGSVISRFVFQWQGDQPLTQINAFLADWSMADGTLPGVISSQNQGAAAQQVIIANQGVNLVPEPASMLLLSLGLAGLLNRRRQARSK